MKIDLHNKTELLALFDVVTNEFLKWVRSFSEEELNSVPYPGSWTAAQVVEHVTRSNQTIIQSLNMDGAISGRRPDKRVAELKSTFLDYTIKLKSPEFILPTRDIYIPGPLLAGIEKSIERLREVAVQANFSEGLNHPVLGEITKLEMFHFVLYHTERHIQQLKKIYQALQNRKYIPLSSK